MPKSSLSRDLRMGLSEGLTCFSPSILVRTAMFGVCVKIAPNSRSIASVSFCFTIGGAFPTKPSR